MSSHNPTHTPTGGRSGNNRRGLRGKNKASKGPGQPLASSNMSRAVTPPPPPAPPFTSYTASTNGSISKAGMRVLPKTQALSAVPGAYGMTAVSSEPMPEPMMDSSHGSHASRNSNSEGHSYNDAVILPKVRRQKTDGTGTGGISKAGMRVIQKPKAATPVPGAYGMAVPHDPSTMYEPMMDSSHGSHASRNSHSESHSHSYGDALILPKAKRQQSHGTGGISKAGMRVIQKPKASRSISDAAAPSLQEPFSALSQQAIPKPHLSRSSTDPVQAVSAGLRGNAAPSSSHGGKAGMRLARKTSVDTASNTTYPVSGVPLNYVPEIDPAEGSKIVMDSTPQALDQRPGAYAGDLEANYDRRADAKLANLGIDASTNQQDTNTTIDSGKLQSVVFVSGERSSCLYDEKSSAFLAKSKTLPNSSNKSDTAWTEDATNRSNTNVPVFEAAKLYPVMDEDGNEETGSSKKRWYCVGACLLLIVVAAVVVGVVVAGGGTNDVTSAASQSITEADTPAVAPNDLDLSLMPDLPAITVQSLRDPESPQALAFNWLVEDPSFVIYPKWRQRQRFALATFYYALNGPNWPTSNEQVNGWMDYNISECDWLNYDGSCTTEGEVKLLQISRLSRFQGLIPPEIQLLEKLEDIQLSNNILNTAFEDFLPLRTESLPPSLRYFNCTSCRLQGSIPAEIGLLSNIKGLALEDNTLSGDLPSELGLLTNIEKLHLMNVGLTGTVPSEVGNMVSLNVLRLTDNAFTGSLPSEIGSLSNLVDGIFAYCGLSGSLPTNIGTMMNLVELNLEGNSVTGPIPTELGILSRLQTLRLLLNGLTGTLPTELARLASVRSLFLSRNSIEGTIPTQFGEMTTLEYLGLAFNRLTGAIPSEVGRLSLLQSFRVIDNPMSESIPSEVAALPNSANFQLV